MSDEHEYGHMLERVDDLKSICDCGQPCRYIYWGFECTVCSPECARKVDDAYNRWYIEHENDFPPVGGEELEF